MCYLKKRSISGLLLCHGSSVLLTGSIVSGTTFYIAEILPIKQLKITAYNYMIYTTVNICFTIPKINLFEKVAVTNMIYLMNLVLRPSPLTKWVSQTCYE